MTFTRTTRAVPRRISTTVRRVAEGADSPQERYSSPSNRAKLPDLFDNCVAVIPARNEEQTIRAVVNKVTALGLDTVVVDDASEDNTAREARDAGAKVLSSPINLGAWIATQTGLRYAVNRDYRYAVTLDADGQHEPGDIPALLRPYSRQSPPNVVIGSCAARGSRLRKIAWSLFKTIGFLTVVDLTSGFRCYDRRALSLLVSRQATLLDYQDVGVLLLLKEAGLTVGEVQVAMAPRKAGGSRIFRSWGRVAYYMVYSTVLCLTKASISRSIERGDP